MSDKLTISERWHEARKNVLKMAGVQFTDNDDLAKLCKQHNLKVSLGDGVPGPRPGGSDEVSALKQEMATMKAMLDEMISRGLKTPSVNAGSDAAVMAEAIAKAVKEQLRPEKDDKGFVDPSYIDPNDRLEKPEIFFSWRHWNLISFSMKHGVAERPPMGPVEFIVDSGRWVRSGDESVAHYVCKAEVRSRKQAEWLRKHEWFGIRFFDSVRNLNSSHGEDWARVAQKWATALAAKKPNELLMLAANNGIGTSIDEAPEDLRRRLIGKLTEGEMRVMAQLAERMDMRGKEIEKVDGALV